MGHVSLRTGSLFVVAVAFVLMAAQAWAQQTKPASKPSSAPSTQASTSLHALTAQGDRFMLDGKPFDMWGIRVASGAIDDKTADHLIAQLDDYRRYGVNAVTVFYSGSSAGFADPFSADGLSIDPAVQGRMERIIRECDQRGMVVIAGIFYQRTKMGFTDEQAARNAVRTVAASLRPFRNVIINIANEQNSTRYRQNAKVDINDPQVVIELCRIVHEADPNRLVGGGGYKHENNEIIGRSKDVDVLLFDNSGPDLDSGALYDRFVAAGVVNKPMVNVETFGAWTAKFAPKVVPGVFPDEVKAAYQREIDAAAARPGLSVFFHNNPWCQGPSVDAPIRFDLAGMGTADDPGIRWYFQAVKEARQLSASTQPAQADSRPGDL